MNLRSRLLLGYWYLVAILILSAAAAALGFHRLGTNIGRVLDENFKSVRASMTMLHALERQDSALLASLLDEAGAQQQMALAEKDFQTALGDARANVTLASERDILDAVEARYEAFCEARDGLIASSPEHPLRAYEASAFPLFESVKSKVLELLDVNHMAMVDADHRARTEAQMRAVVHGLLVAVALLSLVVLSRGLGRDVLDRLLELRAVAQALAAGDRARRATVVRDDELGLVAQQINALLDRELEVEGELAGRLNTLRQLLLGLLESCAGRVVLLSNSGELMAATVDEAIATKVTRAALAVLPELAESAADRHIVPSDAGELHLRRVTTGAGRVVGWLVGFGEGADFQPQV